MNSESSARPDRRAHIAKLGEDLAADFIRDLGWVVLVRNWRCRYGELDLIAVDPRGAQRLLVVVEVKTRASHVFADPVAAVTPHKLSRMRTLTRLWLASQEQFWPQIRFDVVSIQLDSRYPERIELASVRHHAGVFE
ncbi:MAG: YraN family protein [Gordonia sp. (in: high G+C Gram-positive bacteria)]